MKGLALGLLMALAGSLPAAAAQYTIVLEKMHFGPVPAELHPGDTVIWRNNDILRHTATARDGSFDITLPPGQAVSMIVGAPGSVPFYCRLHPGMTGTLVISPQ